MKEFGGYFPLELSKGGHVYHNANLSLKSGRSSLNYILNFKRPTLVYLPYYTCDAVLEPLCAAGVPYKFYEINESLEPVKLPNLDVNDYFIYINYFDLKREYTESLSRRYQDKLIVDCTQAFFMKGNGKSWFFNSCRKFFGTPDGSYLYAPHGEYLPPVSECNENYVTDHLLKRFNGHTQEGYPFFSANEAFCDGEILSMSKISEYLLSNIDYDFVSERRRSNYDYLYQHFKSVNNAAFNLVDEGVPMFFPLLPDKIIDKSNLHKNNVFIPALWGDVLVRKEDAFDFEKDFAKKLMPIPIDHRYFMDDMETIAHELFKYL